MSRRYISTRAELNVPKLLYLRFPRTPILPPPLVQTLHSFNMFPKVFVVLAAVSATFANVYVWSRNSESGACKLKKKNFIPCQVTSPVATSSFASGQQSTITWQDDGLSPSLSSFGPSKISIYAGNAQQQVSSFILIH